MSGGVGALVVQLLLPLASYGEQRGGVVWPRAALRLPDMEHFQMWNGISRKSRDTKRTLLKAPIQKKQNS